MSVEDAVRLVVFVMVAVLVGLAVVRQSLRVFLGHRVGDKILVVFIRLATKALVAIALAPLSVLAWGLRSRTGRGERRLP